VEIEKVPHQACDYFPLDLYNDTILQSLVCNGTQGISTDGALVFGFILQTPLKDFVLFTKEEGEWLSRYNSRGRWASISAPNVSFLLDRGAIPMADMGIMPGASQNRLYYSSKAQIALQHILDYHPTSYTNFIARNLSGRYCHAWGSDDTASALFDKQLADVPPQTWEDPRLPLFDDTVMLGMICSNYTDRLSGYVLREPLTLFTAYSNEWRCSFLNKELKGSWFKITAPSASFLLGRGAIPMASVGRFPYTRDTLYYSSALQLALYHMVESDSLHHDTRFYLRNVSHLASSCAAAPNVTLPAIIMMTTTTTSSSSSSSSTVDMGSMLWIGISTALVLCLVVGIIVTHFCKGKFHRKATHASVWMSHP
jgi:hypothetical protein